MIQCYISHMYIRTFAYIHILYNHTYLHIVEQILKWIREAKQFVSNAHSISETNHTLQAREENLLPSMKLTKTLKIGFRRRKVFFQPSISGPMLVLGGVYTIPCTFCLHRVAMTYLWRTIHPVHPMHLRMVLILNLVNLDCGYGTRWWRSTALH